MTVQLVKLGMTTAGNSQMKGSKGLADGDSSFVKCMDKSTSDNSAVSSKTGTKEKNTDATTATSGDDNSFVRLNNNRINDADNTIEEKQISKDVNLLNIQVVDGEIQVSVIEKQTTKDLCSINLDALMDAIKKFICKKLGIDDEEYYSALEDSGITAVNLVQVQFLQQFYVSVQGMNDFSEVLTDSNLSETWQMLSTEMSEFTFTAADITFTAEELSNLLEQAKITVDGTETVDDSGNQVLQNQSTKIDGETQQEPDITINVDNSTVSNKNNGSETSDNNSSEMSNENEVILKDTKENIQLKDQTEQESLFSQFMNRVEASFDNGNTEVAPQQLRQMREIFTQVIDNIRVNVKPETTGLEIQLNPEQLGKVNVSIEMKNGVATASFIVKNEMARAALESQMQTLKETFENQGLKVEAVEVSVSNFDFSQNSQTGYNEQESNQGKGQFRNDDDIVNMGNYSENYVQENDAESDNEGGINLTA